MQVVHQSCDKATVQFGGERIDFVLGGSEADLAPLFSGSFWSAMIWQRSVDLMCEYIASHVDEFENRVVLELGCGLGVPGITAGLVAHASQVILTDREDDLRQLRRSVEGSPALRRFELVNLDWSQTGIPHPQVDSRAEVILAVECISADAYGRESLDGLVRAIAKVARAGAVLYVCSCRREDTDGLDEVLGRFPQRPELVIKDGKAELYKIRLH
ncbi:hypothetical protein BASA81_008262 [Batrachochytrium salamandrivorans]|nr:hypothetical protein BASA81_008262 [Batrachochytrium salamandrivorans]